MISDDGAASFDATFASGWGAGLADPREVPERGASSRRQEKHRNGTGKGEQAADDVEARPFEPETFKPFDPAKMPQRRWLLGYEVLRGSASSIASPGGAGKTTLLLQRMIAIRTGREITGEKVWERGSVWYINLEENAEEIRRRIAAICIEFDIPQEELGRGFYIGAGADTITLAELQDGMAIATMDPARMAATIAQHGIIAVGIDPLVLFHRVSENANEQMAVVVGECAKLAERSGAAVSIAAHSRKGAQAGDAEGLRGASAIRDGVRIVETLAVMTAEEAKTLAIDENKRRFYVRLDSGAKANYSPPAEEARWFLRVAADLGNGDGVRPADQVGVLRPYDMAAAAAAAAAERAKVEEPERQSLAQALCDAMPADRCGVKDLLGIAVDHGKGNSEDHDRGSSDSTARRRINAALPAAPGYRVVKRDGTDWRIYLTAVDPTKQWAPREVVRCPVPE
jgi:hypothetical protein